MLNAKIKSLANYYPNRFILSAVNGVELKRRWYVFKNLLCSMLQGDTETAKVELKMNKMLWLDFP